MQHLRIAHLTSVMEIGGTEHSILNLCRRSDPNQVVVCSYEGPFVSLLRSNGIEVRVGRTVAELADCLSDASVVNIHWCGFQAGIFAAVILAGKPMVCTLQWLSVLPTLPGPVVCASQHVYDLQQNNRDRLVLITNGVDTDLFQPRIAPSSDRTELIRVCRPAKCDEIFWPSMMRVLEECPEANLTIVGGPPFSTSRVRGLGYRNDVNLLLRGADIFVYAPRPDEGAFDLVLLEAMASGLPCVVTDVPCVSEGVQNEVTGLLVPFNDAGGFATAVIRLIRDRSLRSAMAENAVDVARTRFEVRDRVPLFAAIYEQAYSEAVLPSQLELWRHQVFGDKVPARTTERRRRWWFNTPRGSTRPAAG